MERRDYYLACPACNKSSRISFPESFYFNDALFKCECGITLRSAEMSPSEALEVLFEKAKKLKAQLQEKEAAKGLM